MKEFCSGITNSSCTNLTLNEEVEFKILTTRTRNDSLFCCALLRGTARWSLLGGYGES